MARRSPSPGARARPGPGAPPDTASLWLIDADGSDQRPLLPSVERQSDYPGSWSPDGSQLAFSRGRLALPEHGGPEPIEAAVYLVDAAGSRLRLLVERGWSPSFSPEGALIAYESEREQNGELRYPDEAYFATELHVISSDGSADRRLTSTRNLSEGAPSWSPDGRWIAYGRVDHYGNNSQVLALRPDGSGLRVLAKAAEQDFLSPSWRPRR